MSSEKPLSGGIHFCVGLFLGLFFGLSIGLSFSPVVGALASALVTVAVGWAVLNPKDSEAETHQTASIKAASLRLFGFGLAATVGLVLGLYWRVNDSFSPDFDNHMATWQKRGYDKNYAEALALVQELGGDELGVLYQMKKAAWERIGFTDQEARDLVAEQVLKQKPKAKSKSGSTSPHVTGLFHHLSDCDLDRLNPDSYPKIEDALLEYVECSPETEAIAKELAGLDEAAQRRFLEALWKLLNPASK